MKVLLTALNSKYIHTNLAGAQEIAEVFRGQVR